MLKDRYTIKLRAGDAVNFKCAIDGCIEVSTPKSNLSARVRTHHTMLTHLTKIALMREFSVKLGKKIAEQKAVFTITMKQPEALAYLALYLEKRVMFNTTTESVATEIHKSI